MEEEETQATTQITRPPIVNRSDGGYERDVDLIEIVLQVLVGEDSGETKLQLGARIEKIFVLIGQLRLDQEPAMFL